MFCYILESKLKTTERKSNAGRRPIDPVLMFKVMFVQRLYGLNDEHPENQIKDRISFRDFIGICTVYDFLDARTKWEVPRRTDTMWGVWWVIQAVLCSLAESWPDIQWGKIIDASFVLLPRQGNTREENKTIKKGDGDSLWNDNPHKKCHKDIDARWTKKGGERLYGYRDHAKVDSAL